MTLAQATTNEEDYDISRLIASCVDQDGSKEYFARWGGFGPKGYQWPSEDSLKLL